MASKSNENINLSNLTSHFNINENELYKFTKKKNSMKVNEIHDLSDLETRTEAELLSVLSFMIENKKFFKYCASLLININPGPNYINDYLNLQLWTKQTEDLIQSQWSPHLYSFMFYVYQTMIKEKKDQVVHLLGQIGSGKTFCIIHIIEYFCCMFGPDTQQIEAFDVIHKSIQLVHMVGSIFRENNIESSSCGMLFRLGFGDDNLLTAFDIDAKILDYTLPFSENGRSFSILHAFMTGASVELKKKFDLPDRETNLNFFKKFNKTFTKKTIERFKLNDLEIWNRFHSLLKRFGFTKEEVIELLHMLSFVLNLNEVNISKVKNIKANQIPLYQINGGVTTKRLCKALNIEETTFIDGAGTFKSAEEAKLFIIAMMKYSYYMIFEFVLKKVKKYLRQFFHNKQSSQIHTATKGIPTKNDSNTVTINKKNANLRYINFIDFPGEVEDQTLGGFTTNAANECLNMLSANSYFSIVEKLANESILLKQFQPLHSYSVIQSVFGEKGIIDTLDHSFTQVNFNRLKENTRTKKHLRNCILFNEIPSHRNNEFQFKCKFSHKNIIYNYETLYNEAKSFSFGKRMFNLFSLSSNSVASTTYQQVINTDKDFYSFYCKQLLKLLSPIENIKPFVIYNLHSNTSYKIFFNKDDQIFNESDLNGEIPDELTISMLKHSLAFPVLNWNWYGYKEWMAIETMINEFTNDLVKIKDHMLSSSIMPKLEKTTSAQMENMNSGDKIKFTLNTLSRDHDYIIGKNFVIMKKGTLGRMRSNLNSMIKQVKDSKRKGLEEQILPHLQNQDSHSNRRTDSERRKSTELQKRNSKIVSKRDSKTYKDITMKSRKNSINKQLEQWEKECPEEHSYDIINEDKSRQFFLKEQCVLHIIENNKIINNTKENTIIKCERYNVYSFLDKSRRDKRKELREDTMSDDGFYDATGIKFSFSSTKNNMTTTVSNIVVPQKNHFNIFKNLFDPSKNTNYSVFDYKEYTDQIVFLQKNIRALLGRRNIIKLHYITVMVVRIQTNVRRIIIGKKFAKFVICVNKISFIQAMYKNRFTERNNAALFIQSFWKGARRRERTRRRLDEKAYAEAQGREYEYLLTEEERLAKIIEDKLNIGNKKQSVNNKKKSIEFIKLGLHNKVYKKSKAIDDNTNPDGIIQALLLDTRLLNANYLFNQAAINTDGIDKKLKKKIIELSHYHKQVPLVKGPLEDKLILLGKIQKDKRAMEQLEKYKAEEEELTFHPKLSHNKKYNAQKNGSNFIARMEAYKIAKERNIENLRNQIKQTEPELTFHPTIMSYGNSIRRSFSRLYNLEKIQKKMINNKTRPNEEESYDIKELENNIFLKNEKRQVLSYYDKYYINDKEKEEEEMEIIDMSDIWPQGYNKEYAIPLEKRNENVNDNNNVTNNEQNTELKDNE